ncbi:hypothetical protein [Gemmobacter sp. 24YEA27]|uniref:hypothetical protein n=1 Tax=Gemmobacter sp. 24YEA27 TaxID=3040672 RepID=UPI0024B369C9|nr:hypothetical protein [Gemmobacter sp. 24YEA27]
MTNDVKALIEAVEGDMPDLIWGSKSSGSEIVVSFATPSVEYCIPYVRRDPIEADLRRIAAMDHDAFGAQARLIEAKAIAAAALARIGGE